jgi:peptide chain release factor 2
MLIPQKSKAHSRTSPNGFIPWEAIFDIDGKRKRLEEIEKILLKPGFWDNPEASKDILKERSDLNEILDSMNRRA